MEKVRKNARRPADLDGDLPGGWQHRSVDPRSKAAGGQREGARPPAGLLSGGAGIRAENVAEVVEAEGGPEGCRLAGGLRVGQREQRAELGRGASAEAVGRPGDEPAAELPQAVPARGGG